MADPRRLMGLETEYGCLVGEGGHVHQVIGAVRDWFFQNERYGLIDKHHRDWDEPPGNGGFLFNGGRVYEDMGHLEMCTPECSSFLQVVHYDQANDRLLGRAVEELGLADSVSFIRNNVDHFTGATFGCHENYAMNRNLVLSDSSIFALLTFLTLRGLYTGAGRVGGLRVHPPGSSRYRSELLGETDEVRGSRGSKDLLATFKGFQMTQRADYVENDFFRWVQGNRAIINTRDEPLADPNLYRRLHLLHGDTNVLPAATFLKLGTTSLVLDLLEMDALPTVRLQDPVATLKSLSYHPEGPWEAVTYGGARQSAVDLLESFREAASRQMRGRDGETDAVLDLWGKVNDALRDGRAEDLVGLVDWCSKKYLFECFCEAEGLTLQDPWMAAQDLEYHHVLPGRNLARPLQVEGYWSAGLEEAIDHCLLQPPEDTRAWARSRFMRQIDPHRDAYIIDWDGVRWGNLLVSLADPYELHPTPGEQIPEQGRANSPPEGAN